MNNVHTQSYCTLFEHILHINQGWGISEFALLLFALYKRETVSELISSLFKKSDRERMALDFFKKEQCQWFAHDSSELLSKTSDSLEITCFWQFFTAVPPFYAKKKQIAPIALYKRVTVSELLPPLCKKEWLWTNWSCRSLKKSDRSDSLFFTSESLFALSITKKSD